MLSFRSAARKLCKYNTKCNSVSLSLDGHISPRSPATTLHFALSQKLSSSSPTPKKEPVITAGPAPPHKQISIHSLATKKRKGEKISMVTAYDYPSAVHVDKAGIDVLLVGDSVGMVELGYDTTLPVTLDMIIHHCQAVTRGCRRPLLVADLPFGTFEASNEQAVLSACRVMKEGGMDCVKIEGGKVRKERIKSVVDSGVAVMGHIGLTPQSISALGGFRSQGRTADKALQLIEDALAIEEAGVFAMVVECVPAVVAKAITDTTGAATIGIGSGKYTDGQVLVYHDMLGMMQHYHHAEFTPKFCKQYAIVGHEIQNGLAKYKEEVEHGEFPDENFSPYQIIKEEEDKFLEIVKKKFGSVHKPSGPANSSSAGSNEPIKVY